MKLFSKRFTTLLLWFCIGQVFLYLIMFFFRGNIPFHVQNYNDFNNKYFNTPYRASVPANFIENLTVYDAQWYIYLATHGYAYPGKEALAQPDDNPLVLQYAFFPLYPLLLSLPNHIIPVEWSALILSVGLQLLLYVSIYFVVTHLTKEGIAIKVATLLFIYPFSIFFRSFYTETLFLLLLLWFCFFTHQKKYIYAGVLLGLVLITRGTGILLLPLFAIYLSYKWKTGKITFPLLSTSVALATIPFLLWMLFCYTHTGNPILFLTVKQYWLRTTFPLIRIIYTIAGFPFLPLHDFHASKIDVLMIIGTAFMLFKSRKFLSPFLWWVSFCLWISPLLSHDTMSFSRYQLVNFPLFIYLAHTLPPKKFIYLSVCFGIGLLAVSILFLNFYWIG